MEIVVHQIHSLLLPAHIYDNVRKTDKFPLIDASQLQYLKDILSREEIVERGTGNVSQLIDQDEFGRSKKIYVRLSRSKILKKSCKSFHTGSIIRLSATTVTDQCVLDLLVHLNGVYIYSDYIPMTVDDINRFYKLEDIDERIDILFNAEHVNYKEIKKSLGSTVDEINNLADLTSKFNGIVEVDMLSSVTLKQSPKRLPTDHRFYYNTLVAI